MLPLTVYGAKVIKIITYFMWEITLEQKKDRKNLNKKNSSQMTSLVSVRDVTR